MAGTGNTSVRSYSFFVETTVQGAGTYAENVLEFVDDVDGTPFLSQSILIENDGATALSFRVTADPGTAVAHGVVLAGEKIHMDYRRERRIYFAGAPALAFRFSAR
jgi:hypothetical protein